MKGWVYVISNKSMPGLVKIGYTMKDPEIRASELNGTGVPTPYVVDYEVLIEEPRDVEQAVHRNLAQHREGKEWFRLSAEKAIAGIKRVVSNNASLENYKRADRRKAELIALQEGQKVEQLASRNRQIEAQKKEEKQRLDTLHTERRRLQQDKDRELSELLRKGPSDFWIMYAMVTFGIAVVLAILGANDDGIGLWILSGIFSFVVTPFVNEWRCKDEMNTPRYKDLESRHNKLLANIDLQIKSGDQGRAKPAQYSQSTAPPTPIQVITDIHNGSVKWWNPEKGFGFITRTDGTELFLHRSRLSNTKIDPIEGQSVRFKAKMGSKALEAVDVEIIDLAQSKTVL